MFFNSLDTVLNTGDVVVSKTVGIPSHVALNILRGMDSTQRAEPEINYLEHVPFPLCRVVLTFEYLSTEPLT